MTERIALDRLLLQPNITAGSNILVIASLAYMYRTTLQDADPIVVNTEGEYYRVVDGKHRVMASVIAGRQDVLCRVVEDTDSR